MLSKPDVILLCGGAGLRLRSVTGDAPKGMANVSGRPFLEFLLRQLRRHGFERVVLAVGYQRDAIQLYFGEQAFGLHLAYSAETRPLGTGGASRNAAGLVDTESLIIMNGDSYTDADLSEFVASHREAKADASVVIVPHDERADCGSVAVDEHGRVVGFAEKQNVLDASYVNAGIYIMSRKMLDEIPPGDEVSLERELFPRWLQQGKHIKGFICLERCIDIGTPERYRRAQDVLANAELGVSEPQREGQS